MGSSYSDDFFKGIQGAVGGLITGDFPGAMAKMNALVEAFPKNLQVILDWVFCFLPPARRKRL